MRLSRLTFASSIALAVALASPGQAQEVATLSAEAAGEGDVAEGAAPERPEIVVTAPRLPGQVEAPQLPVITLNEEEIAAYGAGSVADLIAALAPQTGSGRGRGGGFPVLLVNGQRIGSFREMRNFPPEAIRRVEVLPEEVALRFGFPANQRVVNLILKENFTSRLVEAEYGGGTRGGWSASEIETNWLTIAGPRRFNLNLSVEDTSPLTEGERGVIQQTPLAPPVAGDSLPADNRTLISDSRQISLNGTFTTGLSKNPNSGQLSLDGTITRSDSRGLSGLDSVVLTAPGGAQALRTFADPLERTSRTVSVQGGAGLNLPLGGWQLSTTLDGGISRTESRTDRRRDTAALVAAAAAGTQPIAGPLPPLPPGGIDRAETEGTSATALSTLIGRPLRLPAGEVAATLKAGFAYTGIDSSDTRGGGPVSLTRGDLSAGLNLGIPLASRRENALAALGELTLNLSTGINRLSDFGTLTDWSAGLSWSPTEKLGFQASYLVNEAAPSLAQLGSPRVVTFNVPIYDFARGETALVAVTTGGNPGLRRETQRDLKFGLTWQLPFLSSSNFIAEYFRNNSNDVSSSFPVLTPAIEAAFPGRATRDVGGRLIALDQRPVTLSEQSGARLRYGINVGGTIGKAPAGRPGGPGGRNPGGPPPGGGRGPGAGGPPMGGGPGMMAMLGGGGGQGRWNLSLYHTVRFEDLVAIAPGGPVLDLLDGDALSGGGTPRHGLEFEGGAFHKGFGVRLNGRWTAPTMLRASGAPGTSDLRFGALTRIDLRLFADLGQQKALTKLSPFFKGARLSLAVENVLDARQRVTDGSGTVPLSYQPDYLDPRGRYIELEFRKAF
ncbi:MAG: TonB-dependent receptor domain-containing protein [Novosphingobium sp.]